MFQLPPEAFILVFFLRLAFEMKKQVEHTKKTVKLSMQQKAKQKNHQITTTTMICPSLLLNPPANKKKAEGILTRERKIHHCRASFSSVEQKENAPDDCWERNQIKNFIFHIYLAAFLLC